MSARIARMAVAPTAPAASASPPSVLADDVVSRIRRFEEADDEEWIEAAQ
jgi:hypothetical protein